MRKIFDQLRPKVREYAEWSAWRATFQLLDRFLYSSPATTTGAVHVRDTLSAQRLMNNFVIASLPCWVIGMWNTGQQTNRVMQLTGTEMLPGWRGELVGLLGIVYDPVSIGACFYQFRSGYLRKQGKEIATVREDEKGLTHPSCLAPPLTILTVRIS